MICCIIKLNDTKNRTEFVLIFKRIYFVNAKKFSKFLNIVKHCNCFIFIVLHAVAFLSWHFLCTPFILSHAMLSYRVVSQDERLGKDEKGRNKLTYFTNCCLADTNEMEKRSKPFQDYNSTL